MDTSREPFYSRCYQAALFALLIGIGSICTQLYLPPAQLVELVLMGAALLRYGDLQPQWVARLLGVSLRRGLWIASLAMIECVIAIILVAPPPT